MFSIFICVDFCFRSNTAQRNTGDRQRSIGVFSEEKSKPSKEATLSYQQELQQQVLRHKAADIFFFFPLTYNGCNCSILSDIFIPFASKKLS